MQDADAKNITGLRRRVVSLDMGTLTNGVADSALRAPAWLIGPHPGASSSGFFWISATCHT